MTKTGFMASLFVAMAMATVVTTAAHAGRAAALTEEALLKYVFERAPQGGILFEKVMNRHFDPSRSAEEIRAFERELRGRESLRPASREFDTRLGRARDRIAKAIENAQASISAEWVTRRIVQEELSIRGFGEKIAFIPVEMPTSAYERLGHAFVGEETALSDGLKSLGSKVAGLEETSRLVEFADSRPKLKPSIEAFGAAVDALGEISASAQWDALLTGSDESLARVRELNARLVKAMVRINEATEAWRTESNGMRDIGTWMPLRMSSAMLLLLSERNGMPVRGAAKLLVGRGLVTEPELLKLPEAWDTFPRP